MLIAGVIERAERVLAVRAQSAADADQVKSAMRAVVELRSFLASAEVGLAAQMQALTPFPEPDMADVSRESLSSATKVIERGQTLGAVENLGDALDDARITAGHVDVVTRGAKTLEPEQRQELFDRVGGMVDEAAHLSVAEFGRRVRREAERVRKDDGMAKLERQQRATSLSTWTDDEGMWNVRGRFDPVTALFMSSALDGAVDALFAEAVPASCPSDPVEKQKHLRALAFARLVEGGVGSGKPGRPEFVAVIDADAPAVGGTAAVAWPIPIEVPGPILATLMGEANVHAVVVRNGVVLHAPGNLNLGRSTRLANRPQRRALRALYSTCAIPGCATSFNRCKVHHVEWWRHGGLTDLGNLLPVCSRHHHDIHDNGWHVQLGPNRELTVTLPDGSVRNTGPPNRRAA